MYGLVRCWVGHLPAGNGKVVVLRCFYCRQQPSVCPSDVRRRVAAVSRNSLSALLVGPSHTHRHISPASLPVIPVPRHGVRYDSTPCCSPCNVISYVQPCNVSERVRMRRAACIRSRMYAADVNCGRPSV